MARPQLKLAPPPPAPEGTSPVDGGDELLSGLKAGERAAEREFVALFWSRVSRVVSHIVGATHEIEDLTQEVLIRVLSRLDRIHDPASLRPFVTSTAVFVAREALRRRARRRWLLFTAPEDIPEIELPGAPASVVRAVEVFYEVLAKIPLDDRVAFTLRYVDGMELTEVAWATETSVSTAKRRLRSAEARFAKLAALEPELVELMQEGAKWQALAR